MRSAGQKLWEMLLPLRRARFHTLRYLRRRFGTKPPLLQTSLFDTAPDTPANCEILRRLQPDVPAIQTGLPKCLGGLVDPFFVQYTLVPLHRRCLARLHGASLDCTDGMLFLPDGRLLLEYTFFFLDYVLAHPSYYRKKSPTRTIEGPIFTLLGFRPGGHYHWMTEVLYQLYDVLGDLPADIRFLIPRATSAVQRQALEAFGIRPDQLAEAEADECILFTDLWYASPVIRSGIHLPQVTRWVRERLLEHFMGGKASGLAKRKLYITRQGTARRRVYNEADVLKLLKKHGYQMIDCAAMSLEDQIEAFADAEEIIAPHGAGLVNLMFAPAKCRVLEFFPEEVPLGGICYWSLSAAQDLDYTYLTGKSVMNDDEDPDIQVPVPLIEEWLAVERKEIAS